MGEATQRALTSRTEATDASHRPHADVEAAQRFRERRITTHDGLSLYAREYGPEDGGRTPLLCLPGITRNCRDFHDLAQHVAADRRVVCPDMRGRGKSDYDPNPKNYRPEPLLGDVLDLITAFGLSRCVILGTSMGGFLAMGVAIARPRALAGVILNDVSPDVNREALAYIASYVTEYKPQPNWQAAARYGRELVGKGWDKDEETWLRLAHQTYSEGPDGMLYLDYDPALVGPLNSLISGRAEQRDLWPLFRALRRVPTLAVRGALSQVLTAETLHKMAQEKPDLEAVTVAGVGHAPLLDEPEAASAIDGFLARI